MFFSKLLASLATASFLLSVSAAPTTDLDTAVLPREQTEVLQARSMTASQMVDNINTLTILSQNLQPIANSLTLIDGPLLLIGLGNFPKIIQGFGLIVSTAQSFIGPMSGTPVFGMSDETLVLSALKSFVQVHQALLSILIGKGELLSTLPFFGEPVAEALRSLESVVDALAYGIIDVIPDLVADATSSVDSLDDTIKQAIATYSPGLTLRS